MDIAAIKLASPSFCRLPDGSAMGWLRPLSRKEIQTAKQEARSLFIGAGCEAWGELFEDEVHVRIIACSMFIDPDALRQYLDRVELSYLWECWNKIQETSESDIAKLGNWLRKRVNDDPDILLDGVMAYNTDNPCSFYGRPIVDITDGQLIYYLLIRSAYTEFHTPDEKGCFKQASKRWLQSE